MYDTSIKMSFTKISGLNVEIEFDPYNEGGVNDYVLEFAKNTKSGNLVFERGTGEISKMIKWFQEIQSGKFTKRNGTIELKNEKNKTIRTWQFENCYPIKWSGPSLDSNGKEVAIESIEIKHFGLKEK